MRINSLLVVTFYCLISHAALSQSSQNSNSNPKQLRLADQAYEDQIRTILLYPSDGPLQGILTTSTQMGVFNLRLSFDDLTEQQTN